MIVELFMGALHGLASTLSGWMNSLVPSPPAFWVDMASAADSLLGQVAAPIRHFIPFAPLVSAGLFITGLTVVMGFVRLGRRVLSLFTGGGGNA